MARLTKIFKNVSGGTLPILGVDVAHNEQREIYPERWFEILTEPDLFTWINSGDVVVNDGTSDLSIADGMKHAASFEDIKEIGTGLVGFSQQLVFVDNGSTGNEWLKLWDANIPSSDVPGIILFDSRLVGMTFSNARSDADQEIEIWVSAMGDGLVKSRVLTWPLYPNKRVCYDSDFDTDIEFDRGDKVSIYSEDKGTNPKDNVITLHFQAINNVRGSGCENYSGSYSSGGGTS